MRLVIATAALAGLLTAATAQTSPADAIRVYVSGQILTKNCRSFMTLVRNQMVGTHQVNFDAGQCLSFVAGVLDTISFEGIRPTSQLPRICPPDSLNATTAAEMVAKYADENPQDRDLAGYAIVRKAIGAIYPCR